MATEVKYTRRCITLGIIDSEVAIKKIAAFMSYPAAVIASQNPSIAASYMFTPAYYTVPTVEALVSASVDAGGDPTLAEIEATTKQQQTIIYALSLDNDLLAAYHYERDTVVSLESQRGKLAATGENTESIDVDLMVARENMSTALDAVPVVMSIGSIVLGRAAAGFTDHINQFATAFNSKKGGTTGLKVQKKTDDWCGINGQTGRALFELLGKKTTAGHITELLNGLVIGAERTETRSSGGKITVDSFLGW